MALRLAHLIRGEPFQGGPDLYIVTLLAHLDRARFRTRVLVLAKAPAPQIPLCARLEEANIDHEVLEAPEKLRPRHFAWTADRLRAFRADGVHTHEYKSGLIGLRSARRVGATAVATAHGWTANSIRARIYEAMEQRLLRRFDAVIAPSESMRRDLLARGLRPERVTRIHSASEVPPGGGGDRVGFRRAAGVDEKTFLLGVLGRLSPEKGQRTLIRALSELRASRSRASGGGIGALLAGEGADRPSLEAEVRRAGLGDVVTFMPSLPRTRLRAFLEGVDLFVLPSNRENLPLSLMEAMEAGRPILATAVGGVPELIDHGVNGLLVPPDDPKALAAAILRLEGDPALRKRLADEARLRAAEQFTAERFAAETGALYEKVLARAGRDGRVHRGGAGDGERG